MLHLPIALITSLLITAGFGGLVPEVDTRIPFVRQNEHFAVPTSPPAVDTVRPIATTTRTPTNTSTFTPTPTPTATDSGNTRSPSFKFIPSDDEDNELDVFEAMNLELRPMAYLLFYLIQT